jgi:uncharacterized protein YecE (DUF72 family)
VTRPVHVGTSGWQYRHWRNVFYPPGLRSQDWLQFYVRHFETLELNVTFYREVKASTYERWHESVPASFLFSAKMSRFITHIKRLNVESQSIRRFIDRVTILSDRLGVILIQLPPSLKYDRDVVLRFFDLLDAPLRYAIEARNNTFVCDDFFTILAGRNIAWCISESAGRYPYAEAITADFVYLRLHGREELYASSYTDDELRELAGKIRAWGKEAFVYFDNDSEGFAVRNASSLKQMVAV